MSLSEQEVEFKLRRVGKKFFFIDNHQADKVKQRNTCTHTHTQARLQGSKAARLQGCKAARLHSCTAARLQGHPDWLVF